MSLTSSIKKCGRCDKTVYPTEELQCLDKVWHKGCLKCNVCGTTLNVKNVRGYDRVPYCQAHYPQPKPTVVVDNREMQRIRQVNDIQSNAKYHEDFNKSKGKFTVVADDPSIIRAQEQQRIISQAEYVGKRKESNPTVPAPALPAVTASFERSPSPPVSAVHQLVDQNPLADETETETDYMTSSRAPVLPSPMSEVLHKLPMPIALAKEEEEENVSSKRVDVRALFAYAAADTDEISFAEGDILNDCEEVDSGWMYGRHSTTGEQGLLPSNYVEILE